MHYWVKPFPAFAYHMFDLEPGDERLVEDRGPSATMVKWMESEGFEPEKLYYRSKPVEGFFTTDDRLAKMIHRRWV